MGGGAGGGRALSLIHIWWESSDTEEEKKRQLGAWITVQRGHAVANGLPVITVNRTGHETDPSGQTNGIQFWGNSFVAGPQGELLAEFPNDHEEVRVVEIDKARSENVRCLLYTSLLLLMLRLSPRSKKQLAGQCLMLPTGLSRH